MPKRQDSPRYKKQLVIPDATTEKEFVEQARRLWHAAHPKKARRTPSGFSRDGAGIVKMLAEGADIPTIRNTFPGASKTTADHIRTDSRASACIIPDGHRMADGDVRGGNGGPLYDALMELGLSGAMRSSWDGLTRLPEGMLVGVQKMGWKLRNGLIGER